MMINVHSGEDLKNHIIQSNFPSTGDNFTQRSIIRSNTSAIPKLIPNKSNFAVYSQFPKVMAPFVSTTEPDDHSNYMEDHKVTNLFEKQNKYLSQIASSMVLQNNERKYDENRKLKERIRKLEMETLMKEQEKKIVDLLSNRNSSKSPINRKEKNLSGNFNNLINLIYSINFSF